MKNLFVINESERNRILNLHENATKRQYLGEAKVTGNDFGRKIQFDDKDSSFTKEIYGLLVSVLKDGSVGSAIFNVDETALVNAISKIPDLGTLTKVSNELKTIMTQIGRPEYAGLDKIFNQVLNYGSGDTDEVESLITHLNKLGLNKEQTKTLRTGNFVLPSVNVGNPAAKAQVQTKQGQETVVGKQVGNKQSVASPTQSTACPVGDRKSVMAFQDWLDSNHKGWLPNYPQGLNKDSKKGYGMCGPNTRKAWSQYQTEYKVRFVPKSPEYNPEDDVIVPEPSQPVQPTAEPGKQSLASQKSYNTGIGVDNDFTN